MRSSWKTLVAAVAGILVAPQLAMADDVQDQLQQMQERMSQLEEKLQATNDELDASSQRVEQQQRLIDQAGLDEGRRAQSALSRFLSMTEFSGHVSASWNYNFNQPKDSVVFNTNPGSTTTGGSFALFGGGGPGLKLQGENTGTLGLTSPLHQNHNSFQLDQLWFGMHKESTPESRGGFGADICFGAACDFQRVRGIPVNGLQDEGLLLVPIGYFGVYGPNEPDETGDLPHVFQAYASYLAPIGPGDGILIKAGRYEGPIGAESFNDTKNFNITRGNVWALQPVNFTGVLTETQLGENWSLQLGIANNLTNTMSDTDNSKTGVGSLKWSGDRFSLAVNGAIGGDSPHISEQFMFNPVNPAFGAPGEGRDQDWVGLLDIVATWDPSDDLSMWINYDYYSAHHDGLQDWEVHGIAAAARLAVAENTGVSLRYEFLVGDGVFRSNPGFPGIFTADDDVRLWSITGTIDHALTEHLTLRAEGRYDWGRLDGSDNDLFVSGKDGCEGSYAFLSAAACAMESSDQVLALIQMLYEF